MRKLLMILLPALLLTTSCSSVAKLKTDDNPGISSGRSVPAQNLPVFSTDNAGRDYYVLGEVIASADAGTNADIPVDLLREEAAKMGADAIVNLRLAIGMGYFTNAIKAHGTAVKYK